MKLLNAFSLSMAAKDFDLSIITVRVLSREQLDSILKNEKIESAVGHAETATIFSSVLGIPVPVNRTSVFLKKGEEALVGQYIGPRLSEGTTKLPEGAVIRWLIVCNYDGQLYSPGI